MQMEKWLSEKFGNNCFNIVRYDSYTGEWYHFHVRGADSSLFTIEMNSDRKINNFICDLKADGIDHAFLATSQIEEPDSEKVLLAISQPNAKAIIEALQNIVGIEDVLSQDKL